MAAIDALAPRARGALLELLACMAGADGEIGDEERAALRGAAVALGCHDAPGWPSVPALHEVDLSPLDGRARLLAYAAAAWMMLADGIRWRRESDALEALRERLSLPTSSARFLERHARWVRTSTGDLPAHRELDLLLIEAARRLTLVEARGRTAA
jgi:uncharacterized tellurite resistance protein B-like protein